MKIGQDFLDIQYALCIVCIMYMNTVPEYKFSGVQKSLNADFHGVPEKYFLFLIHFVNFPFSHSGRF